MFLKILTPNSLTKFISKLGAKGYVKNKRVKVFHYFWVFFKILAGKDKIEFTVEFLFPFPQCRSTSIIATVAGFPKIWHRNT